MAYTTKKQNGDYTHIETGFEIQKVFYTSCGASPACISWSIVDTVGDETLIEFDKKKDAVEYCNNYCKHN